MGTPSGDAGVPVGGLSRAIEALEEFDSRLDRIHNMMTTVGLERTVLFKRFDVMQKDSAETRAHLDVLSKVIRPSEAELHRRAILEAEIAETMSYQRHRLDKIETFQLRLDARISYLELSTWTRFKLWLKK